MHYGIKNSIHRGLYLRDLAEIKSTLALPLRRLERYDLQLADVLAVSELLVKLDAFFFSLSLSY